jgi:hypothetical protein
VDVVVPVQSDDALAALATQLPSILPAFELAWLGDPRVYPMPLVFFRTQPTGLVQIDLGRIGAHNITQPPGVLPHANGITVPTLAHLLLLKLKGWWDRRQLIRAQNDAEDVLFLLAQARRQGVRVNPDDDPSISDALWSESPGRIGDFAVRFRFSSNDWLAVIAS